MGLFAIKRMGESVRTVYRELFTIKFFHSGYEDPHGNFLQKGIRIVPDEQTQQLFTDHKTDYRFYTDTLICYLESDSPNPPAWVPKIPFKTGDMQIRFLLQSSSDFSGKTYVVAAGSKKTYRFSNKINNVDSGFVLLTAPVEHHSMAKDYEAGTVVQNGVHLFAALKTVPASGSIALSDTTFWKQLQPVEQVVNNADLQDTGIADPDSVCFAVVDMYKNGTTHNSYRLFDMSDQLIDPAPAFTIRFKSRI